MKIRARILLVLLGLVSVMFPGRAPGQTFSSLYFFSVGLTNHDGAQPSGALLPVGNALYGTAGVGGTNGNGSIYSVLTNGSGFNDFHSFTARATNNLGRATNSDGIGPTGGLVLSGDVLYGTTFGGGIYGNGAVFAVKTNGSGFTVLHYFSSGATNSLGRLTNSDGATPYTGLTLSGPYLYGTACYGGTNGSGTVFVLYTNGLGFTTLHHFGAAISGPASDGAGPYAGLLLSGGTLYGTTQFGGTNATGTVFALGTNGSGFTDLHSFAVQAPNAVNHITNSDGATTRARLILSGNTLYGTATFGGTNSYGTVFAINTNGAGFTVLHQFVNGATNVYFNFTNNDGAYPQGGVTLAGNTLYGTAEYGGTLGLGTVFSLSTNGGSFAVVQAFPTENFDLVFFLETNSIGAYPQSALTLSDGLLYGSAPLGAPNASGALFSVAVGSAATPPPLVISRSGTNVLITWPTNFTGYTLQSTTNLAPATWGTVSPGPGNVGGLYVVTNGETGAQKFFRLSQ
jgi:uncharacterized repeat protein (TIGR03803 family)